MRRCNIIIQNEEKVLNTTQIALLEAIKASLFDYSPNYPDDVNWNEVVKEAKAQTVMGIISPVIPLTDEITIDIPNKACQKSKM